MLFSPSLTDSLTRDSHLTREGKGNGNFKLCAQTRSILVYLNGNNAAEGENNIRNANSYPMN